MKRPKIIIWDTEVSTALVRGYGNKWDFRYVKEVRPQELMSYSWKELGAKTINFVHMHEFKSQKEFVKSLADLLNSADITVAHNGINFDDKMANTFFIRNGIDRPSPAKSVDTLRVARRKFKFPSNSLGDLGEYLELGTKESVNYGDLEDEFLEGDKKAIKLMKKYNNRDVELLEAVYKKLLPYIDNHPNMGVYMREEGVCAHCGSTNLNRRGEAYRVTGSVVQWFCKDCKSWCYDRIATPDKQVFREQAKKFDDAKYLAQGTIYPDVIESGNSKAATIKSHHNVGGLPEDLGFVGLVEPLRGLFKDEVRAVGRKLGLPDYLVDRQPFPGPGLAIRIIGELTREKLDLLREADAIFREELIKSREKAS